MSAFNKEKLLVSFNGNLGVSLSRIREFERQSGWHLPTGYSEFLQEMNGGEGFIGEAYVILWRLEELMDMNIGYEVADYAPGMFLFGSDGGGEAFAFDIRSDTRPIVSIPFLPMDVKLARAVAPDFNGFLEKLFKS